MSHETKNATMSTSMIDKIRKEADFHQNFSNFLQEVKPLKELPPFILNELNLGYILKRIALRQGVTLEIFEKPQLFDEQVDALLKEGKKLTTKVHE